MTRVKMLVSVATLARSYTAGEVLDVPDEQADAWFKSGRAEAASAHTEAPKRPVAKKAAPRKPAARKSA